MLWTFYRLTDPHREGIISEDEIVAHEFIFILAGWVEGSLPSKYCAIGSLVTIRLFPLVTRYETTAAALNFTTYLLACNPDVQSKLQQEIDDCLVSRCQQSQPSEHDLSLLLRTLLE